MRNGHFFALDFFAFSALIESRRKHNDTEVLRFGAGKIFAGREEKTVVVTKDTKGNIQCLSLIWLRPKAAFPCLIRVPSVA
jgi:hypothetical protein